MTKITPAQRAKYAVGPHGSYPIFDAKTARAAEALKGKHPELGQKIDRAAARFGAGPLKKR